MRSYLGLRVRALILLRTKNINAMRSYLAAYHIKQGNTNTTNSNVDTTSAVSALSKIRLLAEKGPSSNVET